MKTPATLNATRRIALVTALALLAAPLAPALAQQPSLAGTVVKDSGQPLDQGTVELLEPGGNAVKHRVYTDSRGRFAFRAPAGSYDLRVKFGNSVLPQKTGNGTRNRQRVSVTPQAQTLRIEVKTR